MVIDAARRRRGDPVVNWHVRGSRKGSAPAVFGLCEGTLPVPSWRRTMVSAHDVGDGRGSVAIPPIVDQPSWEAALADLRVRGKAATRERDAIAAARRRRPL